VIVGKPVAGSVRRWAGRRVKPTRGRTSSGMGRPEPAYARTQDERPAALGIQHRERFSLSSGSRVQHIRTCAVACKGAVSEDIACYS
jgi:hypothetical protein